MRDPSQEKSRKACCHQLDHAAYVRVTILFLLASSNNFRQIDKEDYLNADFRY